MHPSVSPVILCPARRSDLGSGLDLEMDAHVKNEYDVRGDVTIIYVPSTDGVLEAVIDTADLERVDEFPNTWRAYRYDCGNVYVKGAQRLNGKRTVYPLHRWLMPDVKTPCIDHIDHNALNNRRSNLRPASGTLNNLNRRLTARNRSGAAGVIWDTHDNRWRARVRFNGRTIHVGTFVSLQDAIDARERVFAEVIARATAESGAA